MSLSMTIADIGGLVAKGEGTAAGNPNDVLEGPRLKPRFGGKPAEAGGGLVAEPDGVGAVGAVPLLNSAQRGHFRFVSASLPCEMKKEECICQDRRTHMTHLTAMAASSLSLKSPIKSCFMITT